MKRRTCLKAILASAGPAALVRTHAVLAALRDPVVPVGIVEEGRKVGVPANNDATPASPITAVGAAHGRAPFAAEGSAARPAGAAFDSYLDAIYEHGYLRFSFLYGLFNSKAREARIQRPRYLI